MPLVKPLSETMNFTCSGQLSLTFSTVAPPIEKPWRIICISAPKRFSSTSSQSFTSRLSKIS